MSPQKSSQYQAYSIATRTVAKTRQIVMLYDGTIRFLKQARTAIIEKRIEERFRLLSRACDVIVGLQNSIDFENGGEVANTLHKFYINMCMRIHAINFNSANGVALCDTAIDELKQMRDVWDNIDRTLNAADIIAVPPIPPVASTSALSASVTLSA